MGGYLHNSHTRADPVTFGLLGLEYELQVLLATLVYPTANLCNLTPSIPAPRTVQAIARQFLLGSIFGGLFILIPLSYLQYFTPAAVQPIHLIVSAIVVFGFGSLSAVGGKQVLDVLSKLVESIPWV